MKSIYKIFTTVPKSHTDILINAMSKAGAGIVGTYTHCAFITNGTGTYIPESGSNPFIGKVGELSKENEDKIEMPCEKIHLEKVVNAINEVHPYETPLIDVIEVLLFTKDN